MYILFPSIDEENWKGKNPPVGAVTAIASMLNPLVDACEGLMLLKNGGISSGKQPIQTINTCGIDSVYTVFAALYAEFKDIKEQIDKLKSNPFCEMVSTMFTDEVKATKMSSLLRKRTSILYNLYENTCHVSRFQNGLISIDCNTNVNYIIPKLLPEKLYSYSRNFQCDLCNKSTSSNRCFVDVDMDKLEHQTIQKLKNCLLDTIINENKQCTSKCGGTGFFETNFSNVISVDVEFQK